MESGLIIGLVFSVVLNLFIVGFILFTGIGKDAWQRFTRKKKHARGGYAYSLMLTKEGNIQEIFSKIDSGKFKYDEKPYIRNPRLTRNFRGMPCHFHMEDMPEPIDPWNNIDSIGMSSAEMDIVMTAATNFDFKEWISKISPFIMIGAVAIIIAFGVSAYFNYTTFQMLRDGAAPFMQNAAVTLKAVGNSTALIPS